MLRLTLLTPLLLGLFCCATIAGDDEDAKKSNGFEFTRELTIPCTPVKHQARTGTCWSFATVSFLESELIRTGKGEHDLSEMFNVRNTYPWKAELYVRLHGSARFGSGGLGGDVLRVLREVGVVPQEIYPGLYENQPHHDHGELDAVLKGMLDAVVAGRGEELSPVWLEAVESVLDVYLGPIPTEFQLGNDRFTPRGYADSLGLRADDYVELTSYTHHPYDRQIALEVPDNWARNLSWNVRLDELMGVIDHALANGFTVAWDGDTSEKSFKGKKGIAILPAKRWADRTEKEQKTICTEPEPELEVYHELRQIHFDRYRSTDDHLMHLVGTARDRTGTRYYLVKNSWGNKDRVYDGFLHMSEAYARAKTIFVTVHRDAVPASIAKRLGLR